MKKKFSDAAVSFILSDSNEVYLLGLSSIVNKISDVKHVCLAQNAGEVWALLMNMHFDIISLDMELMDLDVEEFVTSAKSKFPKIKILLFSNFFERELILRLLQIGAYGFLLKNVAKKEIIIALNAIKKGNPYLSNSVQLALYHKKLDKKQVDPIISGKSRELLFLLAHELTIKQIADHMCVSDKTIEKHRYDLCKAIGVKSMIGLAIYAVSSKINLDTKLRVKYQIDR